CRIGRVALMKKFLPGIEGEPLAGEGQQFQLRRIDFRKHRNTAEQLDVLVDTQERYLPSRGALVLRRAARSLAAPTPRPSLPRRPGRRAWPVSDRTSGPYSAGPSSISHPDRGARRGCSP